MASPVATAATITSSRFNFMVKFKCSEVLEFKSWLAIEGIFSMDTKDSK